MNGTTAYETQTKESIDNLCDKNPDKPYLRSFKVFYLPSLSPRTVYQYLVNIIRFMDEVNKPVGELTLDDYTNFLDRNSSNSPSHQVNVYAALKKFSSYLASRELVEKDYMQLIPRPKFYESAETVNKRESGFLTKTEIDKVLNNMQWLEFKKDLLARDRFLVLLLLNTGIRCSAAYKLNVSDIQRTESGQYFFRVIEKENKINTSYFSDALAEAFEEWMKYKNAKPLYRDQEALFVSTKGSRLDQSSIKKLVTKYCSIDGKHITPHKLRATYASLLYTKTHDVYFVQKAMNHSSPSVTERYIRGKDDDINADVAKYMNELF